MFIDPNAKKDVSFKCIVTLMHFTWCTSLCLAPLYSDGHDFSFVQDGSDSEGEDRLGGTTKDDLADESEHILDLPPSWVGPLPRLLLIVHMKATIKLCLCYLLGS